ncbi:MAG TPA: YwqG family protein [Pseudonocardiaceae bacterium]
MTELDEQRAALREIAERGLDAELAVRVQRLARPALRLRAVPLPEGTDPETVPGSRLGGDALLAPGTPWPRWGSTPLSLLAVIDLSEVDATVLGLPLPTAGLLNFFFEARRQRAWGYDPKHADGWRVILAPADVAVPAVAPQAAVRTPATPVRFEPRISFPGWTEHVFADLKEPQIDAVCDVGMEWEQRIADDDPSHQLGGWPGLIQMPIWRECQLGYHGVPYADQPNDPRVESLEFGNPDWTMLLQLDSDLALRWSWGDGGRLYYAARQEDLAAGDFRSSWMVLQCS